jgi:hypothetical protein
MEGVERGLSRQRTGMDLRCCCTEKLDWVFLVRGMVTFAGKGMTWAVVFCYLFLFSRFFGVGLLSVKGRAGGICQLP